MGVFIGEIALDLAVLYEWVLSDKGVFAAHELAEATIPSDMTQFLARWPVTKSNAESEF